MNPFGAWLKRTNGTPATACKLLLDRCGMKRAVRYIAQVARGTLQPSWRLARALSTVSDGEVSATEIFDWKRSEPGNVANTSE